MKPGFTPRDLKRHAAEHKAMAEAGLTGAGPQPRKKMRKMSRRKR